MSASSNNIRTHCVLRTYYLGKSGIFYVHITVEFVSIYDTSRYLASLMWFSHFLYYHEMALYATVYCCILYITPCALRLSTT